MVDISVWVKTQLLVSIRRRTLFFVMLLFTITSLVVMVIGLLFANHEVEELFDARLAQQARLLLTLSDNSHVGSYASESSVLLINEVITDKAVGHKYESKVFYQLWKGGKLRIASDLTPLFNYKTDSSGYGHATIGDYKWRTFILTQDSGDVRVVVAERADIRNEISGQIVFQTLFPEMLAWPILAFLVWVAVGFGLDPLKQLALRIKQITPTKLEPIELSYVPEELAPVKDALNGLLNEVDTLMQREKRWIADAAHELRTPLSILRVHAQNAESAKNDIERESSLKQLTIGVDRSTRIVSQLLALARLEHQKKLSSEEADVLAISRSMIAGILPLAWDKGIEINLNADEALNWSCDVEFSHIETLLQNLLSNSIKFSPKGSLINVVWTQSKSNVELRVIDNGKGVTSEERHRLSERFYRSGEVEGAGLGLSIVKSIVDKYQGELVYEDSPEQGLTVRVVLPVLIGC